MHGEMLPHRQKQTKVIKANNRPQPMLVPTPCHSRKKMQKVCILVLH